MKKDKKNKNILFLARLYYPHIGGVEKHIAQISELLIKKGYTVTVVCEQHDKKLKLKEQINEINVVRIPINSSEKNKKFHIWKWMVKNRKFIKSFDIIHIHDVFYWIIPIIIGLNQKRLFITFHGYEGYPVTLKSKFLRKMAEKLTAGNICVGSFMEKWYGTKANKVIYGACDTPKKLSKSKKNSNIILFYGRLDDQTGIKEYYKAFLKLKKEYKNLTMRVIGEGKYENELKNVSISEFKSDIQKEINSARFVFVSRYLSMLEAMVEKRLVIAVYTDPLKQDYLVSSPFSKYIEICSSPKELASRVKYFIENPKKEKKKVEEAYKWATKQSWENVVKTYKTIWKI